MCILLSAILTPPACNINRNRYEIAHLHKSYPTADFNDSPCNLMPQHKTARCCRPPPHHMLAAAANVCCHSFQYHPVVALSAHIQRIDPWPVPQNQIGKPNVSNLNFTRTDICHSSIARQLNHSLD